MADSFKISITLSLEIHFLHFCEFYTRACKPLVHLKLVAKYISCVTELVWWEDLREGEHLGYPGVDGRITLKWIFKTWDRGMDWIELAQDIDGWRAVVNVVRNLRVP
jgi:hypothetical protein